MRDLLDAYGFEGIDGIDDDFRFFGIVVAVELESSGENDGAFEGEFFGTNFVDSACEGDESDLSRAVFEGAGSHFGAAFERSDACVFDESAEGDFCFFVEVGEFIDRCVGEERDFLDIVIHGMSGDEEAE